MRDRYGREIDYLRISVTDKCNLRCRYCMPEDIETVPMSEILTFEEIIEIVSAASGLGISKIRVTGGEPLIRRNISGFIRMLKSVNGIEQVTLTTNGVLLAEHMDELKEAGIDGINISIDTLDRDRYKLLTGYDRLDSVLNGISAAIEAGIKVKLNAVSIDWGKLLYSSINISDTELSTNPVYEDKFTDACSLIDYAGNREADLRFIELMPIGYGKGFPGIAHNELIPALMSEYKGMALEDSVHGNGPAVYYKIPGYKGSVGFISAINGMFCTGCNRIRLTTKGYLKSCLCYDTGTDLKEILRSGLPEQQRREKLTAGIRDTILCKPESHCFIKEDNISERNPMSRIGG